MTMLKKNLALAGSGLLALSVLTGCGTDAEKGAQDAASKAGDAAASAGQAASSAGEDAKNKATESGDDAKKSEDSSASSSSSESGSASASSSESPSDSSESGSAAASSSESGAAGGAAAGDTPDAKAEEVVKALKEKYPEGVVTTLDRTDDDDKAWDVDLVNEGTPLELEVDADGNVTEVERDADEEDVTFAKDATVTVEDAIKKALEGNDGKIVDDAELDMDDDKLSWDISFDDESREDAGSVLIDAKTGEVIKTEG